MYGEELSIQGESYMSGVRGSRSVTTAMQSVCCRQLKGYGLGLAQASLSCAGVFHECDECQPDPKLQRVAIIMAYNHEPRC